MTLVKALQPQIRWHVVRGMTSEESDAYATSAESVDHRPTLPLYTGGRTVMELTKWNLSTPEEQAALDRTKCGLPCAGCGTMLETEGDFARHFVLYNRVYRNLGFCPKAGR